MVGMAQLVSAPDCGSGDRGFESHYPPFIYFKGIFKVGIPKGILFPFREVVSVQYWAIAKR